MSDQIIQVELCLSVEQAQKIVAALEFQVDDLEWYHTVHADYASIEMAEELSDIAEQISVAVTEEVGVDG